MIHSENKSGEKMMKNDDKYLREKNAGDPAPRPFCKTWTLDHVHPAAVFDRAMLKSNINQNRNRTNNLPKSLHAAFVPTVRKSMTTDENEARNLENHND